MAVKAVLFVVAYCALAVAIPFIAAVVALLWAACRLVELPDYYIKRLTHAGKAAGP